MIGSVEGYIFALLLITGNIPSDSDRECNDILEEEICSDLSKSYDACNAHHLKKYMHHHCARTCGVCYHDNEKDGAATCRDTAPTAGCQKFKSSTPADQLFIADNLLI